ncbi:MAG: hypothetical protein HOQ02_10335 [Lysobacter sp.]|nr:hypothetical protein [Lysobacter sp.]
MARSLVFMLLAVLVCGGATCDRVRGAPPVDADAMCYQPCTPGGSLVDTGVRWTCDANDPKCWDELGRSGGVIPLLSGKLLTCEARRQACAGFIGDLKQHKVIKAQP